MSLWKKRLTVYRLNQASFVCSLVFFSSFSLDFLLSIIQFPFYLRLFTIKRYRTSTPLDHVPAFFFCRRACLLLAGQRLASLSSLSPLLSLHIEYLSLLPWTCEYESSDLAPSRQAIQVVGHFPSLRLHAFVPVRSPAI